MLEDCSLSGLIRKEREEEPNKEQLLSLCLTCFIWYQVETTTTVSLKMSAPHARKDIAESIDSRKLCGLLGLEQLDHPLKGVSSGSLVVAELEFQLLT